MPCEHKIIRLTYMMILFSSPEIRIQDLTNTQVLMDRIFDMKTILENLKHSVPQRLTCNLEIQSLLICSSCQVTSSSWWMEKLRNAWLPDLPGRWALGSGTIKCWN